MKNIFTFLLFLLSANFSIAQLNMTLVGEYSYANIISDVWGYVAPDGTEYALVGVVNGVSIVSLSDPSNPVEVAFVSGASSEWRDIKTRGTTAYVTNETGNGIAVIDMTELPTSVSSFDWQPNITDVPDSGIIHTCHNIFIDEEGYAYLVGCDVNNGGMLFIDVFSDPGNPVYVGAGPAEYTHDLYVKDQIAYSCEFDNGDLTIFDVSDKLNPILLGSQETPFASTHNVWLSNDETTVFTTDETGNAPVTSYNIEDLNDIQELDQYRPYETLGEGVIPHNVFVWQDWLIISYYTDGCIIVDASNPDNLVEVGNFDTFLPNSSGFDGVWGIYPYLPSGLVIATDIDNGLYVLEPTYVYACYLEGSVTDSQTGATINNASIDILTTNAIDATNLSGEFAMGYAISGVYQVEANHPFYESQILEATLENGELTILDFELVPLETFSASGTVTDGTTGEPISGAKVHIENEAFTYDLVTDALGNYTASPVVDGAYKIYCGAWNYKQLGFESFSIDLDNNSNSFQLEKGIEDGFAIDLGWEVSGNADQGVWERGIPIPVFAGPDLSITPVEDVDTDIGESCYVTGNTSDLVGGLLMGGNTLLTSPVFDLTDYVEPRLAVDVFFLNVLVDGSNILGPDDLHIRISNGTDIITIETISEPSNSDIIDSPPAWEHVEIDLAGLIPFTDQMQIIFLTNVPNFDRATEAAIDDFEIWETYVVSTDEVINENLTLKVFPNPSTNEFTIQYQINDQTQNTELYLFNILGQVLQTIPLKENNGTINIGAELTEGIYVVKIKNGDKDSIARKLVKQ